MEANKSIHLVLLLFHRNEYVGTILAQYFFRYLPLGMHMMLNGRLMYKNNF